MNDLTRDEVAALLTYDPETGVFRWKVDRGQRVKVGDIAGTEFNGYRRIRIKGRAFKAHRLAFLLMTGAMPSDQVDHINGQKDDNRWSNLRDVPQTLNQHNMRKARQDNKTGLLGVHPFKGRFRAQIKVNGQTHHLGTYDSPEVAHAVYVAHKRLLHPGGTV